MDMIAVLVALPKTNPDAGVAEGYILPQGKTQSNLQGHWVSISPRVKIFFQPRFPDRGAISVFFFVAGTFFNSPRYPIFNP